MLWIAADTVITKEVDNLADIARAFDGVGLKLGLEFFTARGLAGVDRYRNIPIFLDLKFHDIPNTVAKAVRVCCTHLASPPRYVTVHAGGLNMMTAAAAAASNGTMVLAVARLTSLSPLSPDDFFEAAVRAKSCGIHGMICPVPRLGTVRSIMPVLVSPGIRPVWAKVPGDDQVVFDTPALAHLADDIVVGRPITQAQDPAAAVAKILEEWNGFSR